jgi:hypothetical protein
MNNSLGIDNPWQSINVPTAIEQYGALRVDPDLKWNFFWALGINQTYGLILQYSENSVAEIDLPNLKGIDLAHLPSTPGPGTETLLLKLIDAEQRDLFRNLCIDLIESTRGCSDESEAVSMVTGRAWRWHHLLRGGSGGKLSVEQQKGLIGELMVLERVLLANMDASDAVQSWTGPLGSPKDFEIGKIGIESKARRGMASQYLTISSAFQLDDNSVDSLYLCVSDLNPAPSDSIDSFTLSDVCSRVLDVIATSDPGAISVFENLLAASGFGWEDDYTDRTFVEGTHRAFRISDGFPKITPGNCGPGVSEVRYNISLSDCEEFATTYAEIETVVRSMSNA